MRVTTLTSSLLFASAVLARPVVQPVVHSHVGIESNARISASGFDGHRHLHKRRLLDGDVLDESLVTELVTAAGLGASLRARLLEDESLISSILAGGGLGLAGRRNADWRKRDLAGLGGDDALYGLDDVLLGEVVDNIVNSLGLKRDVLDGALSTTDNVDAGTGGRGDTLSSVGGLVGQVLRGVDGTLCVVEHVVNAVLPSVDDTLNTVGGVVDNTVKSLNVRDLPICGDVSDGSWSVLPSASWTATATASVSVTATVSAFLSASAALPTYSWWTGHAHHTSASVAPATPTVAVSSTSGESCGGLEGLIETVIDAVVEIVEGLDVNLDLNSTSILDDVIVDLGLGSNVGLVADINLSAVLEAVEGVLSGVVVTVDDLLSQVGSIVGALGTVLHGTPKTVDGILVDVEALVGSVLQSVVVTVNGNAAPGCAGTHAKPTGGLALGLGLRSHQRRAHQIGHLIDAQPVSASRNLGRLFKV